VGGDIVRAKHWGLVALGFTVVAAAAFAGGCDARIGCSLDPECIKAANGQGENEAPTALECIPAKNHATNGGPIKDECGYFVRSTGDDTNEGTTKGKPFATITRAIEAAKAERKPIYLCAETFTAAVEIPKGIEIYGGLNCAASWIYVGASKRTTIAPDPDLVPIKFPNDGEGEKVHVEDVIALAADATLPGGSSIAAIADAVVVELVRTELIAGAGKFGNDGTTSADPIGPSDPTDLAIRGNAGTNACMGGAQGNAGGAMVANTFCETSTGGAGGTGREGQGDPGADGTPVPSPNPLGYGTGGVGATGAANCKAGTNGTTGEAGEPGVGAAGAIGTLDFDGYKGLDGLPGAVGRPGQGGGGGGGAKGKVACYGASGGGGGAGGCGGKGGSGGQAGGSSIALISLGATLVFDTVKLTAAAGGSGGGGGMGQQGAIGGKGGAGGLGAMGASPTLAACLGGEGGVGGTGGRGGGGRGGHSIGIAWTGMAPPEAIMDSIVFDQPGNGGPGDDGTNSGADGEAAATFGFP
jgi:hypothetical protein